MVGVDDLDEPQRALLDAIVRGGPDPAEPMACVELEWLESLGVAAETIDELVALELVDRWEFDVRGRPLTPKVTLAKYGAVIMGVHILERTTIDKEDELVEDPYWAEATREPRSIHLPKRQHEIRWPWMDELPDPKSVHPEREQGNVVDEVSGKEIELFTQLFDGRQVKGVTIKIDRRLKGAKKATGKANSSKRRKAG